MDPMRSCLKIFAVLTIATHADVGMSSQCNAAAYEFCCSLGRRCQCDKEWKPLAFFLSGECNLLKRSFCCNLGCQCSQSISDGVEDPDEAQTSQSTPVTTDQDIATGEVGRGSDRGNTFVNKTGKVALCPLDVPCGNVLFPTAAPGSFCTTKCSEFNGGFWCCAQSDGCPGGGKGNEKWGWCEDQERAIEPKRSSKEEATQRASAAIRGSASEGHRHAQAQAMHHHKIASDRHADWEDVQRRDVQLESAGLTLAILVFLAAGTHLIYFVCSRSQVSLVAPTQFLQSSAAEPLLGTPVFDIEPSVSTSDYSDTEHLKVRCVRVQVHGLRSLSTRPITCSVEVDDAEDGSGTNVHLKLADDAGIQIGGVLALQRSASDEGYTWTKTLTFTDGTWQLLEPRTSMELDHGMVQLCFVRKQPPLAIQTLHTSAISSSCEHFATSSSCSDDWVEIHGTAMEET